MSKAAFKIDGRTIGQGQPPYVVAELSANHEGHLDNAKRHITVAKQCGADAVKLQTYTPDTLTIDCHKPDFLIKEGLWKDLSLYDLYKQAYTPFEWHKDLFDHARNEAITCFSTPFDESAVDLLEDLNAPAYKIASFEAVDLPLVRYVAQTKKPMVISTGLSSDVEIEEVIDAAKSNGCENLILLHCISAYPAPLSECNLSRIRTLASQFNVLTGLSDHSLGPLAASIATALGGVFLEKHFTLTRDSKSPDASFSILPDELTTMCEQVKQVWQALGDGTSKRAEVEKTNLVFRRSLYFVKDLMAGDVVKPEHIRRIRPGYGLAPKYYEDVIGKVVRHDVHRGDPVQWDKLNG